MPFVRSNPGVESESFADSLQCEGEVSLKKIALFLATWMLGAVGQAGQVQCEGDYFIYHMNAKAQSSGNKIISTIDIELLNALGSPSYIKLNTVSSDIREGQYLHASGTGKEASGIISADFDEASQGYHGTLSAQTPIGTVHINITCSLASEN